MGELTGQSDPDDVPFVAVGKGERAPWADEPLTCPECGAGPLELEDSDPPGLTYISHCGKSWLRGQPDFEALFRKRQGELARESAPERNVVCEECGEIIETEPVPTGATDADRLIPAEECGLCGPEDDDG